MEAIKNRYECVVLFDVENGNPNGDPDAGNMPRIDPETSVGIVTDVCLKRKVRNYVDMSKEGEAGYKILVKTDKALNSKFEEAYDAYDMVKGAKGKNADDVQAARDFMCKNYYDVRTFGAVMSTGDNPCGKVCGPVQFGFAKSVDPVFPQEITITRQAITKESDMTDKGKENEMGKKCLIPYGLYRGEIYVSAKAAEKTGFSEEDLRVLLDTIPNMLELDHSAARGKMTVRKLYVFKHDSAMGNARACTLFDKISVKKKEGVITPRAFSDYEITVDTEMPAGVELIEMC